VVQVPPELLQKIASHDSALMVGIIAGLVSAAIFVAGELIKFLYRQSDRSESARAVYRKYADPIHVTTEGLFWRLNEIFEGKGGGYFLVGREHPVLYEHYKALSTLYRLAALLGWIRALRRELFFLPDHRPKQMKKFDNALKEVTGVLAEGEHVQVARVRSLLALLHPGAAPEHSRISEAGTHLDYQLDRKLHELKADSLRKLNEIRAKEVVSIADDLVCRELGLSPVAHSVIDQQWRQCLELLDIREAWVYRDWQAAIGDVTLRESAVGDRKYEVIGYREFEEIWANGSPEEQKWLLLLNAVFDEFDVNAPPQRDARVQQIRSLYAACGRILIAIRDIDPGRSNVTTETLERAEAASNSPNVPA
jgi:hypothetical protein